MCSNCNNSNNSCSDDNMCRIAVTVEDNFGPCTFPERHFDVLIRSRDERTVLTGRVVGGGSAVFTVPCGEYSVTVTGNRFSSPRAQTKRVNCCCGQTAGATFIFMTFEPEDCNPKFYPPCPPPCPPGPLCCPPAPPCPPASSCPPVPPCPPAHPCPPKPIQPRTSLLGDIINEIISE